VTADVTLGNSVLIIIDAQVGFVNSTCAPTITVMADLLSRWQAAGGVTVLTQFVNHSTSPYVRLLGWRELMADTSGVDLVPEVASLAGSASLIVRKSGYSALTPPVLALIRRTGRTNLWISGLDTDSCVLATAVGAFDADLTPWLLTDACASHAGPAAHAAGLLVAGRNIGAAQLVTTADVPAEVLTCSI
jgi:nicotinamidase-related amidase